MKDVQPSVLMSAGSSDADDGRLQTVLSRMQSHVTPKTPKLGATPPSALKAMIQVRPGTRCQGQQIMAQSTVMLICSVFQARCTPPMTSVESCVYLLEACCDLRQAACCTYRQGRRPQPSVL